MNWLVRFAARALEASEREAAIGDLVECGASGWRAIREVMGLVVRRQLQVWTGSRPWLALVGVAGVAGLWLGIVLGELYGGIFQQLRTWQHYGTHYNTGVTSFTDQVIQMSVLAAVIACWSAVSSSLLMQLSGRAAWVTQLLFCFAVASYAIPWRLSPIPGGSFLLVVTLPVCLLIFVFAIPAVVSARRRLPRLIPLTFVLTIAAATLGEIRAHDLERFSHGEFPAASWFRVLTPYVLASWPMLLKLCFRAHRLSS